MDLSVIILSYNTKDITGRCLEHLKIANQFCQKKLNNKIEVIVVDNGSADGSVQMIKQDFPWVKLKALKENVGFSRGNNLAMKQSTNPFILLLNSDVYLEEDSLYKASAYFRVNKNCDVMGARLNYASGKLQPSAGAIPTPLNIIFWIMGLGGPFHPKAKSFFSKAHEVGWVSGAFFMLKRQIFEETLGFDENIFMYTEEVEWCKRIKDKGFKVWYVPSASATHLHGASSKSLGNQYVKELAGIKYYFNKHSTVYSLLRLFLILGLILRIIAFSFLGKTKRARTYVEGLGVI